MKALLTLSEMPENCRECPCKQDDFFMDVNHDMHSVMICGVRGYQSNEPDKRPEWCPLKEADYFTDIEKWEKDEYKGGWNDAMLQIGAITIEQAMPWMKED